MRNDEPIDKTTEREIFNRFTKIVQNKLSEYVGNDSRKSGLKVNQLDVLYQKPEFNAEKQALNDINNVGLSKGMFASVVCFAFLRLSPGALSRYVMRQRFRRNPGGTGVVNPFDQASGANAETGLNHVGEKISANTPASIERPGLFFRAVRLGLDVFVSLSVGAYASLFLIDAPKMMRKASEIPLIEGRSLLSEELCQDFTEEFRKYPRNTWNENHPSLSGANLEKNKEALGSKNYSGFVELVEGFVANCKRRAIHEEEIRNEQGLTQSEPVIIPSPGVPRNIQVNLDDLIQCGTLNGGNCNEDGAGSGGDDYFKQYFEANDGISEEKDD